MDERGRVRWGILGTARIARTALLPALREAGDGVAWTVGGRDGEAARAWAEANGVVRGAAGYEAVLEDREVDAVYIPLPNSLHAEWTVRALDAGKAVLTEKPLTVSAAECERVLAAARAPGALLWEAFVFPFQPQMERLKALLAEGAIGEVREIHASFRFRLGEGDDIRLRPELGGGALNDVGCYPIHLACLLFGREPEGACAMARRAPTGVDLATHGVLAFGDGRRLLFGCGMDGPYDTFARILGERGEIRLDNPYHPRPDHALWVRTGDGPWREERPTDHERSFTPALRHIHAVLRGETAPAHLARHEAMATAQAMDAVRRAWAREGSPAG
ncbi:MAG: Gfo/Idh/MocA family oxidoreductase [Firmicutes bacterium]|nr:Gfo/Idh/MocA family oxidoreductase [Bacillota bacterium]